MLARTLGGRYVDRTRRDGQHPGDHFERCRFPAAVGPEKAQEITLIEGQRHVVDGEGTFTKLRADGMHAQERTGRHHPSRFTALSRRFRKIIQETRLVARLIRMPLTAIRMSAANVRGMRN